MHLSDVLDLKSWGLWVYSVQWRVATCNTILSPRKRTPGDVKATLSQLKHKPFVCQKIFIFLSIKNVSFRPKYRTELGQLQMLFVDRRDRVSIHSTLYFHFCRFKVLEHNLQFISYMYFIHRFLLISWRRLCHFTHHWGIYCIHYDDVIMSAMASQITSLTIVYSSVYPGADQRKHQSPASLAFVQGIHRWPVNSSHKWPVTRKMFPFDYVIMFGIFYSL